MPKVSTIRDVAEFAKVSKATVSRYLNGSLLLPPDTAERVDAAIVALKYRQNSLARRLSLGSNETIGLAMPDVANPGMLRLSNSRHDGGRSFVDDDDSGNEGIRIADIS